MDTTGKEIEWNDANFEIILRKQTQCYDIDNSADFYGLCLMFVSTTDFPKASNMNFHFWGCTQDPKHGHNYLLIMNSKVFS